jgi:hypothetical protein
MYSKNENLVAVNRTKFCVDVWKKLGFYAKSEQVVDQVRSDLGKPDAIINSTMLYKARRFAFPDMVRTKIKRTTNTPDFTVDSTTLSLANSLIKQAGGVDKAKMIIDMLVVQ